MQLDFCFILKHLESDKWNFAPVLRFIVRGILGQNWNNFENKSSRLKFFWRSWASKVNHKNMLQENKKTTLWNVLVFFISDEIHGSIILMIKVILFDFSFIRPSQMPILLNWNRKIMSHVQSHSFQLHRVPTQWCIICTNKHLLTQINFVAITAHFCQNAFCKIQTLIAFIACFLSSYNCFMPYFVLGEM